VPDPIINLLPPDLAKRGTSAEGPKGASIRASAIPNFATPQRVLTDGFWSNLKQFLTEKPIKISGGVRSPLMPTEYGGGFGENFKEFFTSKPVPKGPIDSKLVVAWGAGFGGFGDRIKELFFPKKQAPLLVTSKPIKVKDIWSKDENFGWTQVISISLHAALIALLVIPLFTKILPASTEAKNKVDITPIDLSPYVSKLPAGAQKAGGGGGGGDRSVEPPTKGKAPKFKWDQFTPPEAKIKNPNPKLPMDPSLLGPPDLKVQNPALNNMGDPMAAAVNMSGGPGGGGGIGTGEMGGVGSGSGGGLGPGEGGGTGGGAFRAGVNGVGLPVCLYCPYPQYSDEARKAKYQGTVVLEVTITPDGRAIDIRIVKGPGLGLEEKAIEAVKGWKFKPAAGPNGKIVAARVPIEVTFRLF